MNKSKFNVITYIRSAIEKGFSYIVVSSVINKVLVLLSTVYLTHALSKVEYGYFSYAYNIISIIMIVSSFGTDVALLQFCCEERENEEKRKIERFAFSFGIISNVLFSIGLTIFSLFFQTSLPQARNVLIGLAFIFPFSFVFNYCTVLLRVRLENKKYSLLTNISSFSYLAALILFVSFFQLKGAIVGRYLGFAIPAVCAIFATREIIKTNKGVPYPEKDIIKSFCKFGLTIALTNGVSQLLYYIDVYVVGLVTVDGGLIAAYKTATVIPNALVSLPVIITTFIYPYFAKNKNDSVWIINNTKKIQFFVFVGSIIIAMILFASASPLISLLFGKEYLSSVVPFRILLVSFVISAPFRVISGNIISMLGRVNINFVIGLISCVANVVLDYFFIKQWGSIGAAIATTVVVIISTVLSNIYLYGCYGRFKKEVVKSNEDN